MTKLEAVLSYRTILLITINSIMGTGIFFLPAVGAGVSGPASILAWLFMSFIAVYISMCFAELVSMFPNSGGIYEFCKQAYGRFFSFIIGWMTLVAGNITIAMLVVGAIQYLLPLGTPLIKIILSLIFVYSFNFIAYRGMKTSAIMLVTFAFITLISILGLIIPGLITFSTANLTPFIVTPSAMILVTLFFIAETFFGWETATFLAAETKDGQKVMPKVLVVSTIIIAVLSMLLVITSLAALPWQDFSASQAPLSLLASVFYGNAGNFAFTMLVYLSIIGSVAGWIVCSPRLVLAMAQDKLFLAQMAKIHPRFKTPYKAIFFQTIVTTVLVIVGAGSYQLLLELLVPIVLLLYAATILTIPVLRLKKKEQTRYYKCPLPFTGPILVVLFLLSMIWLWVTHTHGALHLFTMGLGFLLLGVPLYLLLQMYYSEKSIRILTSLTAWISKMTEHLQLPKKVRQQVLAPLQPLHNKSIIEFGASIGTLSTEIIKEALPQKLTAKKQAPKVHLLVINESEHSILSHRINTEHATNKKYIKTYLHPHLDSLHKDIPKSDCFVSVAHMSYLQNEVKVLKEIAAKLKAGAKISILEYDKLFFLFPTTPWLSKNNSIVATFKKAGFDVTVKRKRALLWQYIFITGTKQQQEKQTPKKKRTARKKATK